MAMRCRITLLEGSWACVLSSYLTWGFMGMFSLYITTCNAQFLRRVANCWRMYERYILISALPFHKYLTSHWQSPLGSDYTEPWMMIRMDDDTSTGQTHNHGKASHCGVYTVFAFLRVAVTWRWNLLPGDYLGEQDRWWGNIEHRVAYWWSGWTDWANKDLLLDLTHSSLTIAKSQVAITQINLARAN